MRKYIAFLLIILSVVVFAESLDKVVAIVNDDVITESELSDQVEMLRHQIMARRVQVPAEDVLRKQVLQHLVDVDLQLQVAKNNDVTVDSIELDHTIGKIAADNKLSVSELRHQVSKQGLSWDAYRDNVRKEMMIARIQQRSVSKDVVVSAQQVEDYLQAFLQDGKMQQTFHVQNIVIPLSEEPTTEQLTQARNKASRLLDKIRKGADFEHIAVAESSGEYALEGGDLGERHLAELPEIFAKHVQTMKPGEVVGPLRTGNGFQLLKLVGVKNDHEHHEVTKTHVRHILLKQDASMTAGDAQKQASNLYEQLKSGKDFALMAKQYSLDAASAVKGGDLGWVTSDELVPQFAEAMEKLPLHKVSQPVQTPFGWHLIEVLARKTVDDSDAYQRQQVRQFLQQRKFSEAVQNWQQHLRAISYINVLDKDLA